MEDLDIKNLEEEFNKLNLEIENYNKEINNLLEEDKKTFDDRIIKPFINYCNKIDSIVEKNDKKLNKKS